MTSKMDWRKKLAYVIPLLALYVLVRIMFGYSVAPNPSRRVVRSTVGETDIVRNDSAPVSKNRMTNMRVDTLFGRHDPNLELMELENKSFKVGVVDFERVKTPFIIAAWILVANLAKIGFHMFPRLSRIFPESCLLIVLGVIVGIALFYGGLGDIEASHHLDPDIFFIFMLPPIILDAGYFMPNRLFFDNLGTILVFAVIGTIFNTFTIGGALYCVGLTGIYGINLPILNTFLFAALISAVDPVAVLAVFEEIHVNELLYIVVFGESLLNDAVTVVLHQMFEGYVELGEENIAILDIMAGLLKFLLVSCGGVFIGVVWGIVTAFVTRFTVHVRIIEPLFVFVMAYLSYLNAEIFHLSGILAITFCGMTMKNYVISNVSAKSHTTIKYAMKMLSSSAETVIFMLLGVATVHNHHDWNTLFVVLTIVFCLVFRGIGVLLLCAIVNPFRLEKICNVDKFVMANAGLRGAVAFSLALLINPQHVPQQQMFVTTTIAVVYFTVFVQGISVGPMVEKLGVKKAIKRELTMNERIHERSMDHIIAGLEDIIGHSGHHNFRNKFKHFNHTYLRPLLTHQHISRDPKIMETYSRLTMKDAMKSAVDDIIHGPSGKQLSSEKEMKANEKWADIRRDPVQWELKKSPSNDMMSPKLDINESSIQKILGDSFNNHRNRRLSYSRHAVRDEDMDTQIFQHKNIIDMYQRRKISNEDPRRLNVSTIKQTLSADRSSSDQADGYDNSTSYENVEFAVKNHSEDADEGEKNFTEVESELPWKREDRTDVGQQPLKWHNTPAWLANNQHASYVSPPDSLVAEEPTERNGKTEQRQNPREDRSSHISSAISNLRNSFHRRNRIGAMNTVSVNSAMHLP